MNLKRDIPAHKTRRREHGITKYQKSKKKHRLDIKT